jgi:hypothetical protein
MRIVFLGHVVHQDVKEMLAHRQDRAEKYKKEYLTIYFL